MQSTKDLPAGSAVGLVLGSTSFYAESGGQCADTGAIAGAGGAVDVEVRKNMRCACAVACTRWRFSSGSGGS